MSDALVDAAMQGKLAAVKDRLAAGDDANHAHSAMGTVPLVAAVLARKDPTRIVTLLLEAGAAPDATDRDGNGVAFHAVQGGWLQALDAVLTAGAPAGLGAPDPAYGIGGEPVYTALHRAVSATALPMVRRLLAAGASPDTGAARASWSQNPLAMALAARHAGIAQALVDAGADLGRLTDDQKAALPDLLARGPEQGWFHDLEAARADASAVRHLDLRGPGLDARSDLSGFPELQTLWLGNSGLARLPAGVAAAPRLEVLSVARGGWKKPPLTEAELPPRLRVLDLRGNRIKPKAVAPLHAAHPELAVIFDDAGRDALPATAPLP